MEKFDLVTANASRAGRSKALHLLSAALLLTAFGATGGNCARYFDPAEAGAAGAAGAAAGVEVSWAAASVAPNALRSNAALSRRRTFELAACDLAVTRSNFFIGSNPLV